MKVKKDISRIESEGTSSNIVSNKKNKYKEQKSSIDKSKYLTKRKSISKRIKKKLTKAVTREKVKKIALIISALALITTSFLPYLL